VSVRASSFGFDLTDSGDDFGLKRGQRRFDRRAGGRRQRAFCGVDVRRFRIATQDDLLWDELSLLTTSIDKLRRDIASLGVSVCPRTRMNFKPDTRTRRSDERKS
jgi:hypothetical protein